MNSVYGQPITIGIDYYVANGLRRGSLYATQVSFEKKLTQIAYLGIVTPTQHAERTGTHGVLFATVREADDDMLHVECRFANGEKYAAVHVDTEKPELAQWIAAALSSTAPPDEHLDDNGYTTAMGDAAQKYLDSFKTFKAKLPATFRWSDLWKAMDNAQNRAMPVLYRHVRRGTEYELIGKGRVQTANLIRDMDAVMLYRGTDGGLWARPVAEFYDGRFEYVPPAFKLGRFDHHPDPAIDFCIEVECLQSRLLNAKFGFANPGNTPETVMSVLAGIERAMQFKVGGDSNAVCAKQLLRELENEAKSVIASNTPVADERVPLSLTEIGHRLLTLANDLDTVDEASVQKDLTQFARQLLRADKTGRAKTGGRTMMPIPNNPETVNQVAAVLLHRDADDATRYRYLTYDLRGKALERRNAILDRMKVMSKSEADSAIDSAVRDGT